VDVLVGAGTQYVVSISRSHESFRIAYFRFYDIYDNIIITIIIAQYRYTYNVSYNFSMIVYYISRI